MSVDKPERNTKKKEGEKRTTMSNPNWETRKRVLDELEKELTKPRGTTQRPLFVSFG